ncbi:MAG: rhomboid family intramembrane serine protease [Flavobacteriaceae bacterium]|nr:rhomboid family intramembrane serine protease [Flavobacteriaceae bacterium]MDG2275768.1 rhomboid family intramembrane serine protease [Flavobacteriaceae bacterium]|tara:strand:- start:790 stop:1464 length:675 start_codon:yes stop_codon:yes gene_type:complete
MQKDSSLIYHKNVLWVPIVAIVAIWLIYWVEITFGYNFNTYGILPREIKGLRGVLFSPFIHSDASHLSSNSVPLLVLLASLFYFYRKIAHKVLIYGILLSGLFCWIIARDSYHIGASGVIYLLFSFIFFSGIIRKHYRLIALSLVVIFLYGGMIWFILPTEDRISWEGHLSGFLIGVLFAFLYRKKGIIKEQYQFSETEFDLLFDENGNFSPQRVEEEPIKEDM